MKYTVEDLNAAIASFDDADLEDPVVAQIDEVLICMAKERQEIAEVMIAEENGELDEEEADAAIAEIVTDHAEKRLEIFDLEIFDLEIDLVEADEEYSAGNEAITFAQATGATIANLIEANFSSPEDGKYAITQATGLDEDQLNSVILGQSVLTKNAADAMTACFSQTQTEGGYAEFMDLVANANAEVAQFSSPESSSDPALDQLTAEFNALKQEKELGDRLSGLDKQATALVAEGKLTPHEKNLLFGTAEDKEDAIALFSAVCEAHGVPQDRQIDRITHYLFMAGQRGQVLQFGTPDLSTAPVDEISDSDKAEAEQMFKNF